MARLCILWHLHQPFYGNLETRVNPTSIIVFRTLQNYYPMAVLADEEPEVRLSFNITPVLLKQIQETVEGKLQDAFLGLLETDSDCSEELRFFLKEMPPRILSRHPVLMSLTDTLTSGSPTPRDLFDLKIWLHLSCFHPLFAAPDARPLFSKCRGFTGADQQRLLAAEKRLLAETVVRYRRLQESGRAEISTSPFYHPILPLIRDTDCMRDTATRLTRPDTRFAYPDDARIQVETGLDYLARVFGTRPRGIWPSEGSVSSDTVEMLADCGALWTATDQQVLDFSLGESRSPDPHRRWIFRDRISVFFRDRLLSDLIGFQYQQWEEERAAEDLLSRIERIAERKPEGVITLILDGENPWEWYPDGGIRFLRRFYRLLAESKSARPATFREVLTSDAAVDRMGSLRPGSWMGPHFDNWIGTPAANRAWKSLALARSEWETASRRLSVADAALGRELLLCTEGSDWFWWYSLPADPQVKARFDLLFRQRMERLFRLMGIAPSEISDETPQEIAAPPKTPFIRPRIDGMITDYFEWRNAVAINPSDLWATFRPSELPVRSILYGFDASRLYLRMDLTKDFRGRIVVEFLSPDAREIVLDPGEAPQAGVFWTRRDILELAVPFETIGISDGNRIVSLAIRVHGAADGEIRIPPAGTLTFRVNPEDGWII